MLEEVIEDVIVLGVLCVEEEKKRRGLFELFWFFVLGQRTEKSLKKEVEEDLKKFEEDLRRFEEVWRKREKEREKKKKETQSECGIVPHSAAARSQTAEAQSSTGARRQHCKQHSPLRHTSCSGQPTSTLHPGFNLVSSLGNKEVDTYYRTDP